MNSPGWITIPELEELLNIGFSSTFHAFWEHHVPDKTPLFSIGTLPLNGPWGRRGYKLNTKQVLIEIEQNLAPFHKEISLAHEVSHLVLEREGYPIIYSSEQQMRRNLRNRGAIAENLHSVLIHPAIWFRMREWGFEVDKHVEVKAKGQLEDLESKIDKYPARSDFPAWCEWVLKYVLARLEWGETERQAIYEMFESRSIPIGTQGEKYVRRLEKLGYFEPETVTPSVVTKAGEMFLRFLDLEAYYSLALVLKGR